MAICFSTPQSSGQWFFIPIILLNEENDSFIDTKIKDWF
jgi:hypothetical protein